MWLEKFSKKIIKSFFTSRVTVKQPPHSELSSPLVNFRKRNPRNLKLRNDHIQVLHEISKYDEIVTNTYRKESVVPSPDKRLNEVYHLGYADITKKLLPGQGKRFYYRINEEGKKLIH